MSILDGDRFILSDIDSIENWKNLIKYLQFIFRKRMTEELGISSGYIELAPTLAIQASGQQWVDNHENMWFAKTGNKILRKMLKADPHKNKETIEKFYQNLLNLNGMPIEKILNELISAISQLNANLKY